MIAQHGHRGPHRVSRPVHLKLDGLGLPTGYQRVEQADFDPALVREILAGV